MTADRSSTRLLVFAKGPQPGRVKTRLAPLLGADGAAALYARLVERTLSVACNARLGPVELHAAPIDDPFLRACAGRHGARLIGQTPGDLGARMRNALIEALRVSASAILIGTDCPAITAAHLERAAHAIAGGKDAVVIPVEDGGYALIGVRRVDGRLFENIAWSTASVLAETRRRLRVLGWNWAELETLWDIDRPADYHRLAASGLMREAAP